MREAKTAASNTVYMKRYKLMNILYCGDENVSAGLTLSVLSLINHHTEPLHVYIRRQMQNIKIAGFPTLHDFEKCRESFSSYEASAEQHTSQA